MFLSIDASPAMSFPLDAGGRLQGPPTFPPLGCLPMKTYIYAPKVSAEASNIVIMRFDSHGEAQHVSQFSSYQNLPAFIPVLYNSHRSCFLRIFSTSKKLQSLSTLYFQFFAQTTYSSCVSHLLWLFRPS